MHQIRSIIMVMVLSVTTACVSRQVANVYENEALVGQEGLLLLYVHHNNSKMKLFLKGEKQSLETPYFTKGSNGFVLKLPADEYEVTMYYIGTRSFLAGDYIKIKIEPNHITYPGDVVFNGRHFTLNFLIDDLRKDLEGPFAGLAEKYPLIIDSDIEHDRRWK